jgi:hypothetical protein
MCQPVPSSRLLTFLVEGTLGKLKLIHRNKPVATRSDVKVNQMRPKRKDCKIWSAASSNEK